MTRIARTVRLVALLGLVGAAQEPATAQDSALTQQQTVSRVQNARILVDYVEPRHPVYAYSIYPDDPSQADEYKRLAAKYQRFTGIFNRLRKHQVLEEFSQFLAAVRLPVTLRLKTLECGQANAFYSSNESTITLCYEYVAMMEDRAPTTTTKEGITRYDAVVGQVIGTLLHEAGHALSNLLQLPVLGREEDTADQLAAYLMLQMDLNIARTLIKGEAYGWNQSERRNLPDYWGVHSTALQRQHTYLCMAYGRYPREFEEFVRHGWLPKQRAQTCDKEYAQVEIAFKQTVVPHIDQERMQRVRQRKSLPFDAPQ